MSSTIECAPSLAGNFTRETVREPVYEYPDNALQQIYNASVVLHPKGRHVGPYALDWLSGVPAIQLPEELSCDATGVTGTTSGQTFMCAPDSGITELVDRETFGITAAHQYLENDSPAFYLAGQSCRLATLGDSRFALATSPRKYDEAMRRIERGEPLLGCSDYQLTARFILRSLGVEADIHGVKPGNAELMLSRENSPYHAALVIVSTGDTLRRTGLVELDLAYLAPFPVVELWGIWRKP